MKIKFPFSLVFLFLISSMAMSQGMNTKPATGFKVVGYYFLNAALRDTIYSDSSNLFLNNITHLNIAFINPDAKGIFKQDYAIDTLIKKAHAKNVKVLASIAGGEPHPYYAFLLQDANRGMFINNLISLVERYQLDGIDVDIEGSDIDENYEKFVSELAAALKPINKLLTAAIATAYKDQLPDKALKQFDFVSIMSYDRTGPWEPKEPGDHSPYSMAVEDLDYWHNVRNLPKEKLILGLPFYGYGFGPVDSPVVSMDYKQITELYPGNNSSDTLKMPGDIIMYFNNIPAIKKKTELAIKNAGGVMIWQLLGDAEGKLSLLNTIYTVVHKNENK